MAWPGFRNGCSSLELHWSFVPLPLLLYNGLDGLKDLSKSYTNCADRFAPAQQLSGVCSATDSVPFSKGAPTLDPYYVVMWYWVFVKTSFKKQFCRSVTWSCLCVRDFCLALCETEIGFWNHYSRDYLVQIHHMVYLFWFLTKSFLIRYIILTVLF